MYILSISKTSKTIHICIKVKHTYPNLTQLQIYINMYSQISYLNLHNLFSK